jgi:hypothetical protein
MKKIVISLLVLIFSNLSSASPTPPWGAQGCQSIVRRDGSRAGSVCPLNVAPEAKGVSVYYRGYLLEKLEAGDTLSIGYSTKFSEGFVLLPMQYSSSDGFASVNIVDPTAESAINYYFVLIPNDNSERSRIYDSNLGNNYFNSLIK